MIAFSCSHCGTKLKVKPEFAGRQSKCPSCKQPLVVPQANGTTAFVPPQQIDGEESSLAKAGINAGVTLVQHGTSQLPSGGNPLTTAPLAGQKNSKERYVIEGEIARGGMGAVLRAVDCDIRREVAVKYMLDAKDPKKQARFFEEAQINGQLEHPNIVPVYDLGIDAQKRPFIMMKLVKGRSLKDVLDLLRDNPKTAEKEYSLGRLVNILVNVCNALAFAHSRGVIHRDLKPANVMLGDFGEVYVMDWGLAKVLGHPGQSSEAGMPGPTMACEPSQHVSTSRSAKAPGQSADADLTQEGSVIGTPAYMPPEQATGNLQAIDPRSDVYSLGAILYEMLTLQPPVDKEGGYLSVLMRVMQGEIVPPEQRDPKRTKAGKVPKELAAVAMKAMAKEKGQRYPNVEELRKDIERFQEGRSVSAKDDTIREAVWRLVKRNKLASAFTALLTVVFLWGFWTNWQARREVEKEQGERAKLGKDSVPSFVRAARMMITEKQLQDALTQVNTAIGFDPNDPDARLVRAQLLIGEQKYAEAQKDLEACLRSRNSDPAAKKLLELCQAAKPDNSATLLALADELGRQKVYPVADQVTEHAKKAMEQDAKVQAQAARLQAARQMLFVGYQKRIDAAWPGAGKRLNQDGEGRLTLDLADPKIQKDVKDLMPLQGIPLMVLNLNGCTQVRDLTPLKSMPLRSLILRNCTEIRDLTPLRGMPLTLLDLCGCHLVPDLTPLKGMPLTSLDLNNCRGVTDLSPLHGMQLVSLDVCACQVKDLTPLKGMPLTTLRIANNQVTDLSPLSGMAVTNLDLSHCQQLLDLRPLQGLKLRSLNLWGCRQVSDIRPLKGMPLTELSLAFTDVQDLQPLAGMPLSSLQLYQCAKVRDITPLKGSKLKALVVEGSSVIDLTPLQRVELEVIFLTPKTVNKGSLDMLRAMTSIKTIGIEVEHATQWPAAEFWKRYDKGELK